ncbi:VPLPA-CTERM sorting domain-containing protein [Gymnodinialimonas ulvae]|uniref:VPLPA-CTERM sorting domain-containing protein n=1 Tax=Gymnodinialimonas ulvae TaxID=3126504 RepID=UPI003099BFA3
MNLFVKTLAAAAVAIAAPLMASASIVDFDLTSNGDVTQNHGASVVAESGGLSLTVTGAAFSGGLTGNGWWGDATAWDNGVGLHAGGRDSHWVDGYYDEYLLLSFSEAVDLTAAAFAYGDGGDDWHVLAGNFYGYSAVDTGMLAGSGYGSSVYTAAIDGAVSATQFLIGTTGGRSEWKLHGVSVEVAPVPLPASGLLLLAGLGGVAAMRRRKRG